MAISAVQEPLARAIAIAHRIADAADEPTPANIADARAAYHEAGLSTARLDDVLDVVRREVQNVIAILDLGDTQ